MEDTKCVYCGKSRYRDSVWCVDCLQMTTLHNHAEHQCIFENCSAKAIDKLDVCGNHLVETVYGFAIPYAPIVCNVAGCTEKSVSGYPVCDAHWIIAYKSCLSANSGNAAAASRVSKFYHASGDKIADEYRPAEHPHNTTPIPQCAEEDVHAPQVVRNEFHPLPKIGHMCRCGKPADPKGNKCPECFAKYNALKYGVGRGKCQCGAPLGEKGTMCQACFIAYKKAKFGTKPTQPIVPPMIAQPMRPMMQPMMNPVMNPMMIPMMQFPRPIAGPFMQPMQPIARQDIRSPTGQLQKDK